MRLRQALLALLACAAAVSCSPAPSSPDTHVYLDGEELQIAGICTRSQTQTCESLRARVLQHNPGLIIECNLDVGGNSAGGRLILLEWYGSSVTFQANNTYYVAGKSNSGKATGWTSGFAANRGVTFDLNLESTSFPAEPHRHLFGDIRCP